LVAHSTGLWTSGKPLPKLPPLQTEALHVDSLTPAATAHITLAILDFLNELNAVRLISGLSKKKL
jgi:hypothetical protein